MDKKKPIIISLGGSIIFPNAGIDTKFLCQFNQFIRKKAAEGGRFFIVCGGGQTARVYRDAGRAVVGKLTDEDLDWLGIHATRINAHLLRTILKDISHPRVIDNYDRDYELSDYPIVVCSGWKPGWSTDYDAVILAKKYGASVVINMSNVKMVYDKDPRKFPKARPIKKWSWKEYRKLAGEQWFPGMNLPFDPIAAKLAQELKLKVIILDGRNLTNLQNYFAGKNFIGTTIS